MSVEVLEQQDVREIMRNFCSGLTVITAVGADTQPVGFTCQSFAFLSNKPPLITFNPSRTSKTWPAIRAVGRFTINILAHGQSDISNAFAMSGEDKFAGTTWHHGPTGPIFEGSLGWLACELINEHDGGDHTIVVAQVKEFSFDPGLKPLLYFRGRYHGAEKHDAQRTRSTESGRVLPPGLTTRFHARAFPDPGEW